ncbi:MAG: hypothetical protein NTX44_10350 [Ignavibacteriales bacterium]|nr:hypothetical protein [Ignavibacteriales bacterium]
MDLFTETPKKYSCTLPLLIIGFFIVCTITVPSCKDQTNQSNTSNIIFPDSNVSFSKYVEPLFQQTCAEAGCHGGSQPAANLNLEYDVCWHSLIDYLPPIVIPKNGNTSPLAKYLDGSLAPQMPLRSQPLTKNQINGVKKWIDEGARNN